MYLREQKFRLYWMADALQEVMNRDSVLQVESRLKRESSAEYRVMV